MVRRCEGGDRHYREGWVCVHDYCCAEACLLLLPEGVHAPALPCPFLCRSAVPTRWMPRKTRSHVCPVACGSACCRPSAAFNAHRSVLIYSRSQCYCLRSHGPSSNTCWRFVANTIIIRKSSLAARDTFNNKTQATACLPLRQAPSPILLRPRPQNDYATFTLSAETAPRLKSPWYHFRSRPACPRVLAYLGRRPCCVGRLAHAGDQ